MLKEEGGVRSVSGRGKLRGCGGGAGQRRLIQRRRVDALERVDWHGWKVDSKVLLLVIVPMREGSSAAGRHAGSQSGRFVVSVSDGSIILYR